MRILVADDDRAFTALLAGWLRGKGYQVQTTYDAATTLVSATHNPPDLIVLDIRMPAGNGLETLRRLKALPRTHSIPVIVASGTDDPAVADQALEAGAMKFLAKPVRLEELAATIRAAADVKDH